MAAPNLTLATRHREKHPRLYQLNTRVHLYERGVQLGRPATLEDVEDATLDRLADKGFSWLWLLGVWQTGQAGRKVSREDPSLRVDYARSLPDFRDDDIVGSPFAVQAYSVNAEFGGDAALARLRERARRRGLRLMLDFVVNHVAPDHEWVESHPEWFIEGNEEKLSSEPKNWAVFKTRRGPRILAYGRDPYFAGWPDTLQLDYRRPAVREAMALELERIADRCDGVRCDMAMLVEPDVFSRTWGQLADGREPAYGEPGFFGTTIPRIKRRYPEFTLAAEVYWDLEWRLQQRGFDFTYDKRLYDRLVAGSGRAVREHLLADPDYQTRSIRFLENHDEPRAAGTFPFDQHRAAAVIAFFVPGMRFFHDGEIDGRRVRVPMHLRRRAQEPADNPMRAFYDDIFACLGHPVVHEGTFNLLEPRPAWDGNPTSDSFVAFSWQDASGAFRLGTVNYGPTSGQCYVPFDAPKGKLVLRDLLSEATYERDGEELRTRGLYLDLPAWGHHLFEVVQAP